MQKKKLYQGLLTNFQFEPTLDQEIALTRLSEYCLRLNADEIFLLKGYAGTGKTTIIKSLVKTLPEFKRKVILLAPTGRAAKVMTQYSGKRASTIHRHIFKPARDKKGGMRFHRKENKSTHTLFVVDEASMIQDSSNDFSLLSGGLLHDLIEYVRGGINCKLILIGDNAQLPPVGTDQSPALDANYLGATFRKECVEVELKEVMRQAEDSGILENATTLRAMQREEKFEVPRFEAQADFVRLLEGYEVEDALQASFRDEGREGTSIIVRSNKRANLFNQQIRRRILWQEDEISPGDYLMVVKNNYFWVSEKSRAGFIANGDIIELLEIYEYKDLYDLRFVRVKVRMVDYDEMEPFETVLMLNVLDMPAASLPWEESSKLYQKVLEDYADIPQKYRRHQKVQANPYFNALQVKFAYAITCHKAQGGQWKNVFIEQPWLPTGEVDMDYLRWLYTAITRAQSKVYLMGFKDEYFRE
ncbi:MAG: ATP-dependent DNA helicase [Owenweeksia sp.]